MIAVSSGTGNTSGLKTFFARIIYGSTSPYGVTSSM